MCVYLRTKYLNASVGYKSPRKQGTPNPLVQKQLNSTLAAKGKKKSLGKKITFHSPWNWSCVCDVLRHVLVKHNTCIELNLLSKIVSLPKWINPLKETLMTPPWTMLVWHWVSHIYMKIPEWVAGPVIVFTNACSHLNVWLISFPHLGTSFVWIKSAVSAIMFIVCRHCSLLLWGWVMYVPNEFVYAPC